MNLSFAAEEALENGRARLLPSQTYRQIVGSANRQVGKAANGE